MQRQHEFTRLFPCLRVRAEVEGILTAGLLIYRLPDNLSFAQIARFRQPLKYRLLALMNVYLFANHLRHGDLQIYIALYIIEIRGLPSTA
ncbi:MAG: hypothetical protein AAB342_05610, partial [Chloroflexota bacterium]